MSSYDTETTNIGDDENARAYPVLFIDNDLRDVDLYNYEPGKDDNIKFYRTEDEMLAAIKQYILWGRVLDEVPIVCAYNLMFDLQPLMEKLYIEYDIRANAQSSTNVYTVDLYGQDGKTMLLRFWDTYHLEMRGLAAMGETAGLPKAVGDWDYSLCRTPETELTNDELFYAGRDTQVIPMYLRYLLRANEWMKQSDLGSRVITKTSVVRQMARKQIGSIFVAKRNGKKLSLDKAFIAKCMKQRPQTFTQYALRKACFRGGFTFTAAATASKIVHNVVSLDVTSMHHTFINGRYVPEDFKMQENDILEYMCMNILSTSVESVLKTYERPFKYAIHARIRFINLRLKKGSCFDKWGIALESTSKFKHEVEPGNDIGEDPRAVSQENYVRGLGWHDIFRDGQVAFGKLYSASEAIINVSELELWCINRVYDFDSYEVLLGEATAKFRKPPDFVTLQSNILFDMKTKAKVISKNYIEGEPYKGSLDGIPEGIANELKDGTCSSEFFESWYTSTVKGMFNGIYGTMAQDIYKPSYKCVGGELVVDETTKTTAENFYEKNDINTLRVLYTYGLRIVGGSRMHMVIAMEMLYKYFGPKVNVLGGDTDSMKCACDNDVTDDALEASLYPLACASKNAIDVSMQRVRTNWPDLASDLKGIGSFDIENRGAHYNTHIELWNKCRVSWDGRAHVTCAGLSRPEGKINIETIIDILATKYPIEDIMRTVVGYNVCVYPSVSHALEHHKPKCIDIFDRDITDYKGITTHVFSHESTALYPSARWLGETLKATNLTTVEFMKSVYGTELDTRCRYIDYKDGIITVGVDTENGYKVIMWGEVNG